MRGIKDKFLQIELRYFTSNLSNEINDVPKISTAPDRRLKKAGKIVLTKNTK